MWLRATREMWEREVQRPSVSFRGHREPSWKEQALRVMAANFLEREPIRNAVIG
jgi:hypothetical protein